jgi:hypothetical protein
MFQDLSDEAPERHVRSFGLSEYMSRNRARATGCLQARPESVSALFGFMQGLSSQLHTAQVMFQDQHGCSNFCGFDLDPAVQHVVDIFERLPQGDPLARQ